MRNHACLYMYADEATSICKDLISPLLHPLPIPACLPHLSNWIKNLASKTMGHFFYSENTKKKELWLSHPPPPLIVFPWERTIHIHVLISSRSWTWHTKNQSTLITSFIN